MIGDLNTDWNEQPYGDGTSCSERDSSPGSVLHSKRRALLDSLGKALALREVVPCMVSGYFEKFNALDPEAYTALALARALPHRPRRATHIANKHEQTVMK